MVFSLEECVHSWFPCSWYSLSQTCDVITQEAEAGESRGFRPAGPTSQTLSHKSRKEKRNSPGNWQSSPIKQTNKQKPLLICTSIKVSKKLGFFHYPSDLLKFLYLKTVCYGFTSVC